MPDIKEKLLNRVGVKEITDKSGVLWKATLAEFLGNFFLNFLGCASFIFISDPRAPVGRATTSFSFGFLVFVLVLATYHISGGHLNPAITIAFAVVGKVTIIRAILYIIVQCAGSIAGTGLLKALTPDDFRIHDHLGPTFLSPKLTPFQGVCIEMLLTFFLVFVVFSVNDPNRYFVFVIGPLGIGAAVLVAHFSTLDMTGASMNPARSLGSAVIIGLWRHHWIYWLGPITGAILAGLLYFFLLSAPKEEEYDAAAAGEDKREQV